MSFDTSILDEALTKQRTDWEQNRQALLDEHAAQFGLESVYIFGSLVKPFVISPIKFVVRESYGPRPLESSEG